MAARVDELKMKLVLEQERKDKSLTVEKQIRDNEKDLKKELEAQKEETLKCVEEMTEQYKRMEKKLQADIDKLITEVEGQDTDIKKLELSISEQKNEKENIIEKFDE